MESTEPLEGPIQDALAAKSLGVYKTPTLLIHDLRIDGSPTLDSLVAYLQRAGEAGEAQAPTRR